MALVVGFSDKVLNGLIKGKVERVFATAYPGYALQLGHLQYSAGANLLSAESVTVSGTNLTLRAGPASLAGVRWMKLLRGSNTAADALAFASVGATNIEAAFPQAQYRLRCARLRASVPDSELLLDDLDLDPSVGDDVFFAADPYRRTRFRLTVAECSVSGLAYGELLQGKSYRAKSVRLSGAAFDALVDREKPVQPSAKSSLMLQEALAAIRQPLQLDNLSITNSRLRYGERVVAGADPGVLTFGDASFYVSGLANRREISETISLEARSQFMNAATLRLHMTIPTGSAEVSFHYAGSLGAMNLTDLNPFLEIAEQTQLLSGTAQEVMFEIDVAASRAHGQVRGLYQNLKIAVLDKQTGSQKGFEDCVSSLLANALKIRNSNPTTEGGPLKEGRVNYTRKPQDDFVQLMWFSLRSGVLDVISF